MTIQEIAELAKKGSRLVGHEQWVLADELSPLTPGEVTSVAVASGRNEDTLLQYARAAQRWPSHTRVDGVSFSAHRVALSWHDPESLLIDLKKKYGSPTIKQVRQAMGLEGHPAIELLWKGIRKIDSDIEVEHLDDIIKSLEDERTRLVDALLVDAFNKGEQSRVTQLVEDAAVNIVPEDEDDSYFEDENDDDTDTQEVEIEEPKTERWTPPVATSDVVGL